MTNSLPKLIPVESWMGAIQRTQKSWTMLKLKHNSHQTLTQYTSMKGWENLFTLWRRGELWQGVRTKIERRRKRSWVLKLIASILLLIFLQIFMWTLRTLLLYKLISSEGALVAIPFPLFHITSSRTSKSLYNLLTHFNNFEHLCQ